MQVVAVTDPLELGFGRQAMIGVRATGDLEPVADALAAMDEVDYVVVAAGSFDLLVEVVAESDEHLLEWCPSGSARSPGAAPPRRSSTSSCASRPTRGACADLRSSWLSHPHRRTPTSRCGTRRRRRLVPRPPLPGDVDADVAIVGAGFTGLWTAYYLLAADPTLAGRRPRGGDRRLRRLRAQRRLVLGAVPGVARQAGAAARRRPDARARTTARRHARRPSTRSAGSPRPRASTRRTARAAPSWSPGPTCSCSAPRDEVAHARSWGRGEDQLRLLDRDEPRTWSRAERVVGATYTPDCAAIHPARLVRGLASAVERRGGHLLRAHPRSGASSRAGSVTDHGTVRADVVVRATEGYTPALPGQRRGCRPGLLARSSPPSR